MTRFRHCLFALSMGALVLIAAGTLADSLNLWHSDGLEPFPPDRFIEPDRCGLCHREIMGMWEGSIHSVAFKDPLFVAATKTFVAAVTDSGERADAEHCVACHNPIAYRSGMISGSSDDYAKATGPAAYSLSCDFCHSVTEVRATWNASVNAAPGTPDTPGDKQGPRDDAVSPYHGSEYSAVHTSSEFCGACHNVKHLSYLTQLEGTYNEWYHSPYNAADPQRVVACQDCHMRQSPGIPSTGMSERPDYPGMSSDMMGVERPHIWRHYVTGANTFLPGILALDGRAELAVERLTHAATLEVLPGQETSGHGEFVVRVRNEGAGHMLPTGVTEYRQMWLAVEVLDTDGSIVYSSGITGSDGVLPPGTRTFMTVFGDVDGNPTMNVARAAMLLTDHRIPPKGWVDEQFVVPGLADGPLTVRVRLLYRSLDPSVAELLLGKPTEVPVVTMTELETQLSR